MFVFDASTLILIAKAELLDLFLAHAPAVVIPNEVFKECCGAKKTVDAAIIQKAVDEGLIATAAVRNRLLVTKLQSDFSLGRGEAEAISLALNEKAQLIGIDDKNGIDACKVLNVPFVTAAGILVRCLERGLLERGEALSRLALLARHGRYKDSILDDARKRVEAKP